jgi:hypothetical protein
MRSNTKNFRILIIPFFLISSLISIILPAQTREKKSWTDLTSSVPIPSEITLISSDIEMTRLEINTQGFWKQTVRMNSGIREEKVYAENSTPIMVKGAPDLEKITTSLIIPDRARIQIDIIEEEHRDFTGMSIIPSKGNLTRDINPDDVPYEYGREYSVDAFYPGVAAELRSPHIIRDIRGQVVVIYPFRYNPVQKILRVYTRLVIEVKAVAEDGENPLTGRREDDKTVRAFEGIYNRNFLNYNEYRGGSRYTPLEEDGNMLIISYGSFMTDMQNFVHWKNMEGIPTEMVNVSSVGTTAAQIKAYVANYYNTNGLTYLLLVGDAAQVPPSSTTAGTSDNDYGYIVGSDHYPDIFVGRFSAETNAQVQTQVLRTLNYEKEPDLSPGYFQRAMCIGSDQGAGDDGEYDYQHQRNIRTDYMNYTYTYGAELYDGSQGGQDAAGSPTTTMVSTEINTGTGIISYTGHGSNTSWGTTGYSSTNVASLTNTNKLPFILSVACVNGNFAGITCFAEAWMRATYNGQPSGAVATIMSTINQSWNPPMRGQDEMVDILVENHTDNIKRTFGGICMNGCMNMNDVYGSAGSDMTDTWTIFGDPSLMVRTAAPATMTVTHASVMPVGSSQLTVYCNQEGARVAVSDNYTFLGSGIVNGGSVNVSFGQINIQDTMTVTVTAFNCHPAIDSVLFINANMAYASSSAFHGNLTQVAPGAQNAEVLGIRLEMSGSLNPFNLNTLILNMNGTTNLQDVDGLAVYYTGNSPAFNTTNLFGTASVSAGNITITGSRILSGGYNYFWLAYDLDAGATVGHAIDAQCTGLILSDNINLTRVPAVTAPSGSRQINLMQLQSITTAQPNKGSVSQGASNADIIRIDIQTAGTPVPLQVSSIKVSTSGTTSLADLSQVRIYYTPNPVFSTAELLGSASPAGQVTINSSKALTEGANYFWVAYTISAGATPGNELDAECLEVTFAGSQGVQIPTVTDPAGYRMIQFNYCVPAYTSGSGYGDFISLVSLNTLSKSSSASPSPYYTYYQDFTTYLATGKSYQLTVSPGTYGSGNNIAAWIDFDRDGVFDTEEKLGEVNVAAMPATGTMTFQVPANAITGITRLRVREVWSTTGIGPCTSYSYGETEDYDVHIMPPACWLGFTSSWNSTANWSDGVVPGTGAQVIIPENLMGDYFPAVFSGNPSINQLNLEDGSTLHLPAGVTITVGGQ